MTDTTLEISHPRLQRLYQYWSAKRGQRKMPSRADIAVSDIAYVVGDVMLVDVIDGAPPRFRIRLHGTNLAERAGHEITGKMLDELPENDPLPPRWRVRRPALPLRIDHPAALRRWREGQHGAGGTDPSGAAAVSGAKHRQAVPRLSCGRGSRRKANPMGSVSTTLD